MPPHHRRQSRGVSIESAKRPLDGRKKRKTVDMVIPVERRRSSKTSAIGPLSAA